MLARMYTELLNEYLQYFPCVAIIGSRQCGKTTLLRSISNEWQHFDLEDSADFDQISSDPDLFLRSNPCLISIDEAQLCPPLFSALRVAIDKDRQKKGRFIISGSSSPELLKEISDSLAGRVAMIEMAPFTFREAYEQGPSNFISLLIEKGDISEYQSLSSTRALKDIEHYWLTGGYPEPWVEHSPRFQSMWMEQFIRTYLERDIAKLFPGLNQQKFRLFLRTLSNLNGQIINYSDVARSLGVSQPTARDYFQIAHGTFIWRNIPSYEKNVLKRVTKHPKGYYRDSGLLNHLLRVQSHRDLYSHPNRGNMWEALVIEDILRSLFARGVSFDYYYYRTAAGAEVDLILDGSFGLVPIEIKLGQKVEAKSLKSLKNFVDEHHCKTGFVINNDEKIRMYTDKIIGIPFSFL